MRYCYNNILLSYKILNIDFAGEREYLCAASVTVFVNDFIHFIADNGALALRAGKDIIIVSDPAHQLIVLINDLLPFQCSQPAQLHGKDGVRLYLVNIKQPHQARAGFIYIRRPADKRYDFLDHIQRFQISLEDMVALLRLTLQIPGAPFHNIKLMRYPVTDECVKAERTRHAVHQGKHIGAECLLQLCVLIKIVEHYFRDGVAFKHEDQPLACTPGGFVAHISDTLDLSVAYCFPY